MNTKFDIFAFDAYPAVEEKNLKFMTKILVEESWRPSIEGKKSDPILRHFSRTYC